MKTGKVYMSDFTKKQLQAVGWKPGDPVPGDLGQRLQEIQAEVVKERQEADLENSELAAGWTPPVASFVNIEDLPPEKQDEIRGYLAEYKEQMAQQAAHDEAVANVDASIPENVQGEQRAIMRNQILQGQAAMAARQAGQPTGESVVIDDREQTTAPPADMQVPEGKTYAGSIGAPSVADKIEHLKQQQATAQQPEQPAASPTPEPSQHVSAGAVGQMVHCPRCAWNVNLPFDVKPTETDKQKFMAAVLGLARFEKKYDLLGGKLAVFFRSLTSEESAILQQRLGAMVRSGESIGDGEYWAHLMEFRLVMSVSRIEIGGNITYQVPPLQEWARTHPAADGSPVLPTDIPRLRDYFYKEGPTQEPVRRILGQTHRNFQRLVELLEVMTNDPDFWEGIELPD